jgi:arylsulfatase A-like enzyme
MVMRYRFPAILLAALTCTLAHGAGRPNFLLLMADNWAWPHASAYGDPVVKTPTFDQLAREGMLFRRAYCSVPSCSPARAVLLTGQAAHRLEDAASLHSRFPARLRVFPDALEAAGYAVGYSGKGWGPGKWDVTGRPRNPAGDPFQSLTHFLDSVAADKSFCFWMSSRDPHVPWTEGRDFLPTLDRDRLVIPPHLPDDPNVREDLLGYYCEVQNFDRDCGRAVDLLRSRGLLDETAVLMLGDNGWQVPRGLAHMYDLGTHVPLVVRWPKLVRAGAACDAFVSFEDLAPTLLELAGLEPLPEMTGRSLKPLLQGKDSPNRDAVFLERERHAHVRAGNVAYPCRAIRTRDRSPRRSSWSIQTRRSFAAHLIWCSPNARPRNCSICETIPAKRLTWPGAKSTPKHSGCFGNVSTAGCGKPPTREPRATPTPGMPIPTMADLPREKVERAHAIQTSRSALAGVDVLLDEFFKVGIEIKSHFLCLAHRLLTGPAFAHAAVHHAKRRRALALRAMGIDRLGEVFHGVAKLVDLPLANLVSDHGDVQVLHAQIARHLTFVDRRKLAFVFVLHSEIDHGLHAIASKLLEVLLARLCSNGNFPSDLMSIHSVAFRAESDVIVISSQTACRAVLNPRRPICHFVRCLIVWALACPRGVFDHSPPGTRSIVCRA